MKSPWKYLVELASQGRRATKSDGPPEIETSRPDEPSKEPAEQARVPLDLADGRTSLTREMSSAFARDPDIAPDIATPAGTGDGNGASSAEQPGADDNPPAKQVEPLRKLSAKKRQRGRRPVRNVADQESEGGKHEANDVQQPLTFTDEVIALDEEVAQLRVQLAQKLRQQNKQLQQLLDRFTDLAKHL